jgi:hypothetical protein
MTILQGIIVFLGGAWLGLVVGGVLTYARIGDEEAERVAEEWRWARMSPVERLEALRTRTLGQRDS